MAPGNCRICSRSAYQALQYNRRIIPHSTNGKADFPSWRNYECLGPAATMNCSQGLRQNVSCFIPRSLLCKNQSRVEYAHHTSSVEVLASSLSSSCPRSVRLNWGYSRQARLPRKPHPVPLFSRNLIHYSFFSFFVI